MSLIFTEFQKTKTQDKTLKIKTIKHKNTSYNSMSKILSVNLNISIKDTDTSFFKKIK